MTLPGWVGFREPRGRLGGRYTKNVTICPTYACTTPRLVIDELSRIASDGRLPSAAIPEVERLPRAKNEILKKGSQTRSGGLRATWVDVQAV